MKYLFMGEASSSIMIHGFSWHLLNKKKFDVGGARLPKGFRQPSEN
jgi:hypothetical protein